MRCPDQRERDSTVVDSLHDFSFFDKVLLVHGSFLHHLNGYINLTLPLASHHSLLREGREGGREGWGGGREGERGGGRDRGEGGMGGGGGGGGWKG